MITKEERAAIYEIGNALCSPPEGPRPSQIWLTAVKELESMHEAARLNFRGSRSGYDRGRMEALRAAVERLTERLMACG